MRFIELFAGIGGFRYGLEQASEGFVHVWSNEYDRHAVEVYENQLGEIDTRDIRNITSSEIPDHDLLTAGFPCQAFSIAGQQRGFEETRGTLFFEVARILRDKRPRYFILENVKNLVGHKSGQTIQTIFRVLSDLGYDYQWEVLGSQYYGVPQLRERVFIVGNLRGESRRQVLPLKRVGTEINTGLIKVGNVDDKGHNSLWGRVYNPEGFSATINAHGGGVGAKTGLYAVVSNHGKINAREMSTCLDKNYWKGLDNHGQRTMIMELYNKGFRIRKLTPLECERLQGFPSGWTEGLSDTRRYMVLGNAVTTKVITEIGKKLI